jgi:hypothetical protein
LGETFTTITLSRGTYYRIRIVAGNDKGFFGMRFFVTTPDNTPILYGLHPVRVSISAIPPDHLWLREH